MIYILTTSPSSWSLNFIRRLRLRLGPDFLLQPLRPDFLRPWRHLERFERRERRERLLLELRLRPGLRLHTLVPFLRPRLHFLERCLLLLRLGPVLRLHLPDLVLPLEHLAISLKEEKKFFFFLNYNLNVDMIVMSGWVKKVIIINYIYNKWYVI